MFKVKRITQEDFIRINPYFSSINLFTNFFGASKLRSLEVGHGYAQTLESISDLEVSKNGEFLVYSGSKLPVLQSIVVAGMLISGSPSTVVVTPSITLRKYFKMNAVSKQKKEKLILQVLDKTKFESIREALGESVIEIIDDVEMLINFSQAEIEALESKGLHSYVRLEAD